MAFQFKYRQYSKALYQALIDDPFYITMEQSVSDDKESREAMLRYMEYSIAEAIKYGKLYIPGKHEYRLSIWSKPLKSKSKEKKKQEKQSFLLKNMTFYQRLGYQAKESFYEPKTQAEYWLMVRECGKDKF